MKTFRCAIHKKKAIKKYDDNSIIIDDLNYETHIINIKTMKAIKNIFPERNLIVILY